jgi:protein-tyrosine phosphatase
MLPFADTHVHLLAGLDDGPPTQADALAMCRVMAAEGTRFATALAHQNPEYPANTPDRLKAAAAELAAELKREKIPLHVYPSAEVMLNADTAKEWEAGKLLSLGGHGKFLLVEQPHGFFMDPRPLAHALRPKGVRLVLAHAERYPELTLDAHLADRVVAAGCLLQISADAIARPHGADLERALKGWAKRGMIHLLGSDGHGLGRREPRMAAGVRALAKWIGQAEADRIAGIAGPAVLQGLPVNFPRPKPKPKSWFARLFGR